jgi:hypothetical protein
MAIGSAAAQRVRRKGGRLSPPCACSRSGVRVGPPIAAAGCIQVPRPRRGAGLGRRAGARVCPARVGCAVVADCFAPRRAVLPPPPPAASRRVPRCPSQRRTGACAWRCGGARPAPSRERCGVRRRRQRAQRGWRGRAAWLAHAHCGCAPAPASVAGGARGAGPGAGRGRPEGARRPRGAPTRSPNRPPARAAPTFPSPPAASGRSQLPHRTLSPAPSRLSPVRIAGLPAGTPFQRAGHPPEGAAPSRARRRTPRTALVARRRPRRPRRSGGRAWHRRGRGSRRAPRCVREPTPGACGRGRGAQRRAMVLLHGALDVFVERAEHLPRTLRIQVGGQSRRWGGAQGPTRAGRPPPRASFLPHPAPPPPRAASPAIVARPTAAVLVTHQALPVLRPRPRAVR